MNTSDSTPTPGPAGPFWPRKRQEGHPNLRFVRYAVGEMDSWKIKDPTRMGTIFAKWIGALSSILTIGFDGLIDTKKLSDIKIDLSEPLPFDFPNFPVLRAEFAIRKRISTFPQMIKFYRNAFAHGNIELLPGFLSLGMRNGGIHVASGVDFVAIAIWNGPRRRPQEQRDILYLAFEDVVDLVFAIARLCEEQSFWKESALRWSQQDVDSFHGLQTSRGEPLVIVQGEPFNMPFAIYEPLDIDDEPHRPE